MKYNTLLVLLLLSITFTQAPKSVREIFNQRNRNPELLGKIKEYQKQVEASQLLEQNTVLEDVQQAVEEEVDSIKESILLTKLTSSNYTNSTTNYTSPNSTYNYTYTSYPQQYVYSNQSNTTNETNQSNPYNNYTYNYSYPSYGVNNYVSYNNQSNTSNNTNTTNGSYPYSYNYTYPQYNSGVNYYTTYNNQSNDTNNTNTTNTTNSSYPSYDPYVYDNTTYYNSSQYNNQTYNDNSTYYDNSTQYNNYTRQQRLRNRFDQSRINLKLRNKMDQAKQNNNFTQIITFFNQTSNQYEYIVLFNNSEIIQKQSYNDYYYYENSTLVTLQQYTDYYGNVYYRSLNYNFKIVVTDKSLYNAETNSVQLYGTIVYYNDEYTVNYNKQTQQSNRTYTADQPYVPSYDYSNNSTSQVRASYDKGYSASLDASKKVSEGNYAEEQSYTNSSSSSSYYGNADDKNSYDTYTYSGNKNFYYNESNSSYQRTHEFDEYTNTVSNTNYGNETNRYSYGFSDQYKNTSYGTQNTTYQGQKQSVYNYDWDNTYDSLDRYITTTGNVSVIDETENEYYEKYTENSKTYPSTSYSSNQSSSDFNKSHTRTQSHVIQNGTQQFNTTDYSKDQQSGSSQQGDNYYYGWNYTNAYTNDVQQQAHISNQIDQNVSNTQVVGSINSYNTSYYQSGNSDPYENVNANNKNYSFTVTEEQQQFNQLRGSKKQVQGGWKQVSVVEMMNSNSQIIEQAIQAVNEKFNPQAEGYTFDQIISVSEQIVSGINYNVKLQYSNIEDSNIYEVVIYSIPWVNKQNQITSCIKLDQQAI